MAEARIVASNSSDCSEREKKTQGLANAIGYSGARVGACACSRISSVNRTGMTEGDGSAIYSRAMFDDLRLGRFYVPRRRPFLPMLNLLFYVGSRCMGGSQSRRRTSPSLCGAQHSVYKVLPKAGLRLRSQWTILSRQRNVPLLVPSNSSNEW